MSTSLLLADDQELMRMAFRMVIETGLITPSHG
jgi:hypothetical protein